MSRARIKEDLRDNLSVDDALLAMSVYEWSAEKIIEYAELGNLRFNKEEFLKTLETHGIENKTY